MNANNQEISRLELPYNVIASELMVVVVAQGRAKFPCPNFMKFSQSDGVSVGVRLLMLDITHVQ